MNYDLPWNPMRIEQRIGRVHRLKQTRDVYVANFYAKGTVDEDVYHILSQKLRMFELLFGQVTTVLGDLERDDGEGDTFEYRVLQALASPDDQKMHAKLQALGRNVEEAYETAQNSMRSAGSINEWATESRPKDKQARELLPDLRLRTRQRQRAVREFVRDYLSLLGPYVTFEDGDREFLSAKVPEELVAALGGRRELHLAFGAEGLELHRDAELCAVGSEVFEDLVASLNERGDLVAVLPDIPAAGPVSSVAHSERLSHRRHRPRCRDVGQHRHEVATFVQASHEVLEYLRTYGAKLRVPMQLKPFRPKGQVQFPAPTQCGD